jgi:ribosomal protein S16
MKKKYPHNIIRLRKGKRTTEGHTLHIVAILNKRKLHSFKYIYKLGYLQFGKKKIVAINFSKLAFFLNKGFILKKSVKKLIGLIVSYKFKDGQKFE